MSGTDTQITYNIWSRRFIEVNTDPQRRCYNGVHAKSEMQWTGWDWLDLEVPQDRVDYRLNFWRELNDYAISERGESARQEFKAFESTLPAVLIGEH